MILFSWRIILFWSARSKHIHFGHEIIGNGSRKADISAVHLKSGDPRTDAMIETLPQDVFKGANNLFSENNKKYLHRETSNELGLN